MPGASIQQQINPPVAKSNSYNFSDAPTSDSTALQSGENKNKTDFRSLITNSVDEIKKKRAAKENGDLQAGSDEEFLEKLADQTKEKRVPKNELGKDDFLKLFVTQLQNQDPMNPDDGTEMAAKLAQFNGLEQMMNVNKGIEKLISAQGTDRNLQLINYIGKEVSVDGGRLRMKNGSAGPAEFTTEAQVAAASLEVRDGNGILVSQKDLGALDKGTHPINWDGKNHEGKQLPDGNYTYAVSARSMDGEAIPVTITSKARITGIDIKSTDGALYSDFGKITFDQIKSVGRPGFDAEIEAKAAPGPAAEDMERLRAEGRLNLPGNASAQSPANKAPADGSDPKAANMNAGAAQTAATPNAPGKAEATPAAGPKPASSDHKAAASAPAGPAADASPEGTPPGGTPVKKEAASKKAVDPKASNSAKLNEADTTPSTHS